MIPMSDKPGGQEPSPTGNGGRSVVVTTFVTLDGYMVGPDEDMSWTIDDFDRDMQAEIAEDMSTRYDLFVFGRLTYEIFKAYWPNAVPYEEGDELKPAAGREDPRIIRALNETPKLVFSTTMKDSDWDNTQFAAGGPEAVIRRLKAQPGKDISVQGSASVVQALERAGLIDEYRLFVHPVLLGVGKPLFATDANRQDLELVRLDQYPNGVLATTYARKGED
jgi:dihydrofolate reductase